MPVSRFHQRQHAPGDQFIELDPIRNQGTDVDPSVGQQGDHLVQFIVSDGALPDTEEVTITVENVNVAPVLENIGTQTVTEGETLTIMLQASDADGDSLSFTADNLPLGASLNSATGEFT